MESLLIYFPGSLAPINMANKKRVYDRLVLFSQLYSITCILLISNKVDIYTVPVDGKWCEIDSESDLRTYNEKLEEALQNNIKWKHDWR